MRNTNNYNENSYWHYLRLLSIFLFINFYVSNVSYSQSFLSASGTRIVNSSGTEVLLEGVNLGNWVVQEGWMISMNGDMPGTQGEMKKILYDKGFTDAQVETFYQGWRDNFITKADIDFIASKGFNCVRFPMHYELFLTPTQRAVRNTVIKNKGNYSNYKTQLASWVAANTIATDYTVEGYRLIDNLLSWCAANNIYVILDMHAVPGSQGTDEHIADCLGTPNDLWYSTVNQDVLNAMWKNISSRYKNNATVAMYDLINEPNNSPNTTMRTVHQRLISTIRNNGDNHLIMIEGNGWGNNYTNNTPDLFTPRTDLVYNIHRYDFDAWACPTDTSSRTSDKNQIQYLGNASDFRKKYNVPIFCGETGLRYYDWMKRNTESLVSMNIGWTLWSYKWHTPMSYDYGFGNIPGITPAQINTSADMSLVLENIKFANMDINTNAGFWEALKATPVIPVSVTGVSVSPTSASVFSNGSLQLTATIAPSNATNKSVTWSSSNSGVATVNSSGLVSGVSAGTTIITVTTQDGSKKATSNITVTVPVQSPYSGSAIAIPGIIEAENFDTSGESIAYHDAESANQGSQYRVSEGVDVEACNEGGYDIGWTAAGEWLEYTINVATAGSYNIDVRVASTLTTGSFHLEFNGVDKTGVMNVPNTTGWQSWQNVTKTGVSLSAGQHIMRLYVDAAGFNLNKITISSNVPVAVTGVSVSPTSTTLAIGSDQQLTANVAPTNASNKTVSWSSSNGSVATVNSSGVVTAVALGNATITATTQDGNKTATCSVTVDASTSSIFSGYYNIISVFSEKALDIKDKSTQSGANVQQWGLSTTGGGDNQRWRLDHAGNGNYYIKVKSTQMCLSLQTADNSDGVKVIQETCNSSDTQKWTVTDMGNNAYKIVNVYSAKLLDVTDVSNQDGALIQVYTDNNGGTNQQWTLNVVENINTKINDLNEQEVMSIYPNPALDVITIKNSENNIYSVEIYTISGELLHSSLNELSSEVTLNIEHLKEGVYVIKTDGPNGILINKFIKK